MNAALCLALAMCLDAAAGEPRILWARIPHPAVLMGSAVGALDTYLNNAPFIRAKGVCATILLVSAAALIGWALASLGWLIELIAVAILLAHKSLLLHVSRVAEGLRLSTSEGRRAVGWIVSRDVSASSDAQVARAGIESLSENFSDGVIAPAFWFLVGGLPGILIYKTVNTADSMIGYLTPEYAEFGWAAAKLDDVLNWAPARLTSACLALVSGVLGEWSDIRKDAELHRSPNAGWPEAAMARALGIALAGPRNYHGKTEDLAWVNGNGRRETGPKDIDAALRIVWKAWVAILGVIGLWGVCVWVV